MEGRVISSCLDAFTGRHSHRHRDREAEWGDSGRRDIEETDLQISPRSRRWEKIPRAPGTDGWEGKEKQA